MSGPLSILASSDSLLILTTAGLLTFFVIVYKPIG